MIDVSALFGEDCGLLSASAYELGESAGRITWDNCLALAKRNPLVNDDNRDNVRDHFAEYGAWERSEIDAWDDTSLSAMIWQEGAADMRHFAEHCDENVDRYQADCEAGRISGRLMVNDGKAVIYLGI